MAQYLISYIPIAAVSHHIITGHNDSY